MGEPKPPPDDPAISKEVPHLVGARARGDVEVLRRPPEQKITKPSTDDVSRVSVPAQTADDFRSIIVDHTPRKRMGVYNGFGRVVA
jgi:hypothetical protein